MARRGCHDHNRAAARRETALPESEIEEYLNAYGRAVGRREDSSAAALEALDTVPDAEREAARLFYLDGLSIAEIAAQAACPEGTVKRRLFWAREHLRRSLGARRREEYSDE